MMRRLLFAVTLLFAGLNLLAQSTSPAWKRAEHLRHGINASEWLAQSHDYSPQRLRTFTTLDDIAKMHAMGFDHVRLSIDPAIFDCHGPWNQCERVQVLDEVIAKALSQDLAVILDVHPSDDYKRQLASSDNAVDRFAALWNQIATYYAKSNPDLVFFEILNEPEVGVYRWAGIQQTLVSAIRRQRSRAHHHRHLRRVFQCRRPGAHAAGCRRQLHREFSLLQSAHFHSPGSVVGRGLLGQLAASAVSRHFRTGRSGHCQADG